MFEESLDRKLNAHIIWNLASVGVLAVSGLIANSLIGRLDGPLVLGVFNQVTALYFVTSQLSMLGVNFSVLKHVAEWRDDKTKASTIAHAGIGLTVVYSVASCLLAYLALPLVGALLKSQDVLDAWRIAIPTMVAFNLNKTILAVMNAHDRMIRFAVFAGIRFLLVLAILAILIHVNASTSWIGAILGLAELTLFFLMLPFVVRDFLPLPTIEVRTWVKIHFTFGLRGYLTAIALELNSKITVLVAGIFLLDSEVGVYSMATMFLDGLLQFLAAVRNNFNPLITRHYQQGDIAGLEALILKAKPHLLRGAAIAAVVSLLLFPVFVTYVLDNVSYLNGLVPLAFLVFGFTACATRFPFNMIFIQSGHPGAQTAYNGGIVLLNIVLNLALTPLFGTAGAALGTALSFAASAVVLKWMAKPLVGVRV